MSNEELPSKKVIVISMCFGISMAILIIMPNELGEWKTGRLGNSTTMITTGQNGNPQLSIIQYNVDYYCSWYDSSFHSVKIYGVQC